MPPLGCRPPAAWFSILLALIAAAIPASADELLQSDQPTQAAIDHYISGKLAADGIKPVAAADDVTFARRVTLDLAGRIPTVAEVKAFVESPDPDKRARLVDRLLDSPDYALHHANWLDAMLMGGDKIDREWLTYLRTCAAEDRPWDRMFREMMIGSEDGEPEKHALAFLKDRAKNADDMANDVSRLFFGVSINCAQCHDHPLVLDWTQDHYFGFKSFFDRTYLTKSSRLAEKYSGEVKYKTTAGEEKTAAFMFLTGDRVEEPKIEKSKEQLKKEDEIVRQAMKDDKAPPPPPPEFSPRAELVTLALKPENSHFFAKSIVNRVWDRFLGRGLVHPVDQMHAANPPSHPDLMDWLARDVQANEYRLKKLIRGIVLSETYARGSRWTSGDRPYEEHFAVAQPRVLTPRQYSLSLIIATTSPEQLPPDMKPDDWRKRREQWENQSHGLAGQLEWPSEHFQVSVDEALLFSNGERIQNDYLRDSGDRLVGHLKGIEDRQELIRTAYRNVLAREPEAAELTAFEAYLQVREDREIEGIRQIVWALITSPELRFNY